MTSCPGSAVISPENIHIFFPFPEDPFAPEQSWHGYNTHNNRALKIISAFKCDYYERKQKAEITQNTSLSVF